MVERGKAAGILEAHALRSGDATSLIIKNTTRRSSFLLIQTHMHKTTHKVEAVQHICALNTQDAWLPVQQR